MDVIIRKMLQMYVLGSKSLRFRCRPVALISPLRVAFSLVCKHTIVMNVPRGEVKSFQTLNNLTGTTWFGLYSS